jgi:hypothetical protein
MTRAARSLLGGLPWLLLAACGGASPERDAASWAREGAARFAEAQAYVGEGAMAQARPAWREAARAFLNAFRLEDPVPERREVRALLAFRAGRALGLGARQAAQGDGAARRAQGAFFWLGEAEALEPALRQVHYERALLRDGDIPGVADPDAARIAYQRYLARLPAGGGVPESERARVERARERVEALAR